MARKGTEYITGQKGNVTSVDFGFRRRIEKRPGSEVDITGREIKRLITQLLIQIGFVDDEREIQFMPDGNIEIPTGLETRLQNLDDATVRGLLQGQLDTLRTLVGNGYDPSKD